MSIAALVSPSKEGDGNYSVEPWIYVTVLFGQVILLLPLCLINDMRQFKVIPSDNLLV